MHFHMLENIFMYHCVILSIQHEEKNVSEHLEQNNALFFRYYLRGTFLL